MLNCLTLKPGTGGALNSPMENAVAALRQARQVVFFTGAGISASSGIPTFREKLTGLWERYDPEALETAKAFQQNPPLVWGWYLWRRYQVSRALPNAAHDAIVQLAAHRTVTVVTQNIDDLHERAGSAEVIHLHGSLHTPKCFACHRFGLLDLAQLVASSEGQLIEPPRCKRCNGKLRPAVVWFGEMLPADAWRRAMTAIRSCDLLISIGTSGAVQPAASIPATARRAGAVIIHINKDPVNLAEDSDISLIGDATALLPTLVALTAGE